MNKSTKKETWITIQERWEAGATTASLAKEYGLDKTTIHWHIRKEGWNPDNRPFTASGSKKFDWDRIRAQYEAGAVISKLSRQHRVSTAAIHLRKRKEQWTPKNASQTAAVVRQAHLARNNKAKKVPAETEPGLNGVKVIPKGRSVGQPLGEIGADQEVLSKFAALQKSSAPEAAAVIEQAATEIELTRQHRRMISRASVVAENILARIHALVVDGVASDVITFKTKDGNAYHRVPFLGDRESVSDALLKCANAVSKLVPLERQAHGLLNIDKTDTPPKIVFNMPNIRVISVDGKGSIVKAEDAPALIEGEAPH